jgi:hypothetical protein
MQWLLLLLLLLLLPCARVVKTSVHADLSKNLHAGHD